MTALPKQRISRARQGQRRTHLRLKGPALHECPQCHAPKRLHHVCPACGYYRGEKIITPPSEESDQASA
jgi:large subunit ribosomal protein L32